MKFRIARQTNNLNQLKSFYIDVLGFEVLVSFENHDNYKGIFIGKPQFDWHLEFTQSNEIVEFHFNEDDALVFYPEKISEYNQLLDTVRKHNISFIKANNPYWNENGKMILDPDGYRVIISNLKCR
jgi:catechol 2,3-dioxygenase-like lactoylglutathione lyase family enzyme